MTRSSSMTYSLKTSTGVLLFPEADVSVRMADPTEGAWSEVSPGKNSFNRFESMLSGIPDVAPARTSRGLSVASIGDPDFISSTGALTRPNGELYLPRKVRAGTLDIDDVTLVKTAYDNGIPLLLTGPPGTGKTALAEAALGNLHTISGTGDTEVSDFVGGYNPNPDGTFTWVDGPLLRAMEAGEPVLIDEVALIDPRVMAVAYSVMDGRGELVVTANQARGTVKAAEGFYVLAACNPDVPGAVMSEALTSRFLMHVEVLTDFDLAVTLGVPREIVSVAKNLKRKKESDHIISAPQMRELLAFKTIAEAFGVDAALSTFLRKAEPGDRDDYREALKSVFGKDVNPIVIE